MVVLYLLENSGGIRGGSGRNVNILGGDSFSHCEKESSYEYVSNSGHRHRTVLNLET
jgi:hypothetical protein